MKRSPGRKLLDKDKDGKVSLEEQLAKARFEKMAARKAKGEKKKEE